MGSKSNKIKGSTNEAVGEIKQDVGNTLMEAKGMAQA